MFAMRMFSFVGCCVLALSVFETGGSSGVDSTWLEAGRKHRFDRRDGPDNRGPMASLERQLLQLKTERARWPFFSEVALPAENDGTGTKADDVPGAGLEEPLLEVTSQSSQQATRQTGRTTSTPKHASDSCVGPTVGDFPSDIVRQLVNYAGARAADEVIQLLLLRAASNQDKWKHVRSLLRELDKELETYQDENMQNINSTPAMHYADIRSFRAHDGKSKLKKHKKKGVKKKPRHKEKVKIKADSTQETHQRWQDPNVLDLLPSARRSDKIFLGNLRTNDVFANKGHINKLENIWNDGGPAATKSSKNSSPLEELLHSLLANTYDSNPVQTEPLQISETYVDEIQTTKTTLPDIHWHHENDVLDSSKITALEKVSFIEHEEARHKDNGTRYSHALKDKMSILHARLQQLRKEEEEQEEDTFLRVFHNELEEWRSQPTLTTTPRENHDGEEGKTTSRPGVAEAVTRQPESTTATPTAPRHGGGSSPRRRLFAYHRVTASPKLRAPPHSAFVAVSVVSPTSPGRRRPPSHPTTLTPSDDLEKELLQLVVGAGQKREENRPRSHTQDMKH